MHRGLSIVFFSRISSGFVVVIFVLRAMLASCGSLASCFLRRAMDFAHFGVLNLYVPLLKGFMEYRLDPYCSGFNRYADKGSCDGRTTSQRKKNSVSVSMVQCNGVEEDEHSLPCQTFVLAGFPCTWVWVTPIMDFGSVVEDDASSTRAEGASGVGLKKKRSCEEVWRDFYRQAPAVFPQMVIWWARILLAGWAFERLLWFSVLLDSAHYWNLGCLDSVFSGKRQIGAHAHLGSQLAAVWFAMVGPWYFRILMTKGL
ncbi:hypothetical protein U1Q18_036312 [Sarracenia purpurea var. burkii]